MTKGFKPTFTITNRINVGLTRIEGTRDFLEAETLSANWSRARFSVNGLSTRSSAERLA